MIPDNIIHVLLIEDEPGDAGLVMEALRWGEIRTRITHVRTLDEALRWLAGNECDIVLTDLSLPDSQGFPTIKALQAAAPALPVIVLTGNDDVEFALSAVQAGTQDYLVKGQVDGPALLRSMLYAIQRKQLESELREARDAAESATRAKAHFFAVMSHEIRTPMNGILGLSRLLLDTGMNATQRNHVQLIQESASNLLTILNDILDLSKLEAERMEVENIPFDLPQLISGIVALLTARSLEKNIRMAKELDPAIPRLLIGDAGRLRQILLNLVGNAVKFTVKGEVKVRVQLRRPMSPGRVSLRFEVIDTGIGIAPEIQPTLFSAFTQGDPSVSRRFGGTGLGLAICRRIIDCLGGRIGVDSTLGSGSQFWFELDFEQAGAEHESALNAVQHPGETGYCPPLRVLLAEDNLINQGVARGFLEAAGHTVTIVGDGDEAVAAVREASFDVVLMDLQMPHMDGLEATRAIRALPGPEARVPIVALTASAMKEDILRCQKAGMDGHLPKPIMPQPLNTTLMSVVPRARQAAITPPAPQPTPAPAPSPPPEASVLDRRRVTEIMELLGQEAFAELLEQLTQQLDELETALRAATRKGDAPAAARVAHSIKGASANLGMSSVSQTAAAIQSAFDRGEVERGASLQPTLSRQIAMGIRAIRTLDGDTA